MARTFDAQGLIELPKLDSHSAAALGQALLTLAEAEKKLPARVGKERGKLQASTAELQQALEEALAATAAEPGAVRATDRQEQRGWSALEALLAAWAKLPAKDARVARAEALHATLFPQGLKWVRGTAQKQWAESDKRLAHIKAQKLDAELAQLGGELFLTTIKEAHARFGEELGITQVKQAAGGQKAPELRVKLDAFKEALRGYTLQLVAQADEAEPHTVELRDRLLEPLVHWKSTASRGGTHGPDGAATAPAGGGASK